MWKKNLTPRATAGTRVRRGGRCESKSHSPNEISKSAYPRHQNAPLAVCIHKRGVWCTVSLCSLIDIENVENWNRRNVYTIGFVSLRVGRIVSFGKREWQKSSILETGIEEMYTRQVLYLWGRLLVVLYRFIRENDKKVLYLWGRLLVILYRFVTKNDKEV